LGFALFALFGLNGLEVGGVISGPSFYIFI
jgi:hypothetical protein